MEQELIDAMVLSARPNKQALSSNPAASLLLPFALPLLGSGALPRLGPSASPRPRPGAYIMASVPLWHRSICKPEQNDH